MNYTFVSPRSHPYNRDTPPENGMLVIETDDGKSGDYTHWLPLCLDTRQQYSQWQPMRPVPFCPDVNSYNIGQPGYMTFENLRKLNALGCEVMSHGRYHTGLGLHHLSSAANVGDASISVTAALQLKEYALVGTEYRIFEGETEEIIRVATKSGTTTDTPGTITLITPLVNAYTTNACIRVTIECEDAELLGGISDLAAEGVTVKHHVYTYHGASQYAYNQDVVDRIGTLFESARGLSGQFNTSATNRHLMQSQDLHTGLTTAAIDALLDTTKSNNYLTIFYGHGESDATSLVLLKYLITGCFTRGIRILSRSDAVRWLYGS